MESKYLNLASISKAISDETRLKIIDVLSCSEMCACEILKLIEITQSTLSYHMSVLTDCGLVNGRKDGSWMRYSLNKKNSKQFVTLLNEIFEEKKECICKTEKSSSENHCCK